MACPLLSFIIERLYYHVPLMESSLFLAQLIGLYLLLIGAIMTLRRRFFIVVVKEFIENRTMRVIIPIIELVAGLALVLLHNVWVMGYEVVITIFGWLMVAESFFYLAAPEKMVKKFMLFFNKRKVYLVGGVLSVLLGAYLMYEGFEMTLF